MGNFHILSYKKWRKYSHTLGVVAITYKSKDVVLM